MSDRPHPRFNHVAITVPAALLDAPGRRALLDFYADVFGWQEMPTLTRDRELLVLRAYSNEQFVYVHAAERPMTVTGSEHLGMSVTTPEELDAMLLRAKKRAETDADVEITDRKTDDFGVLKLHSFYVRYRLPLSIEVQCFEWAEGVGAQSFPEA